jgi:predicted RNA-binding Zn ribbon-like protein
MDHRDDASPPSRAGLLSLVAGNLALDFCNTISGRGGTRTVEHLRTPIHVLEWARHAGAVDASATDVLAARGQADRGTGDLLIKEAHRLRETCYRIAAAIVGGEPPAANDLHALASAHAAHLAVARLALADRRFYWVWDPEPVVPAILVPITLSAMTLLTEHDFRRLKRCPGHDCGWLFYDTSKNGRRRWCEMEVCGNRAKVRAFRSRHGQDA